MRKTGPLVQHFALSEIVDHDSLSRFCESFARLHGVCMAVLDTEGEVLVQARAAETMCDLLQEERVCEGHMLRGLEALPESGGEVLQRRVCRCGLSHEILEIQHLGVPLGWFVAGPYRPREKVDLRTGLSRFLKGFELEAGSTLSRTALARLDRMEPRAEGQFRELVTALGEALKVVIKGGYERYVTAQTHMVVIQEAYDQLAEKNARLAESVKELKSLDRMKSNFLATMSHELRTPLTSIVGYSEMLLEGMGGPLEKTQIDFLHVIMEKGEQLMQIISEVLDISKIETGKIDLRKEWIDLSDVIRDVLGAKVHEIQNRELSVTHEATEDLPRIWCDRTKIRQVLLNLMSNAIKFTPEGGSVKIRADHHGADEQDPEAVPGDVLIRVSDTGIGIPEAYWDRIFESFFQVDNSSTREYGGTGLGLAIVRNFVEAHGGQVWLDTEVEVGTTFVVRLPVAPPKAAEHT